MTISAGQSDDPPAVTRLLAAADEANQRGDAAAARAALQQLLKLDADHPRALNTLGIEALRRGDAPAAAAMLARAAARAPAVASIRVNQADVARACGDRAAELGFLQAALAIDPYLVPALIRKAQALEATGGDAVPVPGMTAASCARC